MTSPRPPTVAIVLAAGLGTRMRSRRPKVLHPLCGRPMLAYVVDAARAATGTRPLVVTSPSTAAVRDAFGDEVAWALQDEPRGTGDAVAGRPRRAGRAGRRGRGAQRRHAAPHLGDRGGAGGAAPPGRCRHQPRHRAPRRGGRVRADRARRGQASRASSRRRTPRRPSARIGEVNAGLYAFDAAWLRGRIGDLRPSAGHRRALPDRPRRARPFRRARVVTALEVDGREGAGRHQRPGPARPTSRPTCAGGSSSGTCSPA